MYADRSTIYLYSALAEACNEIKELHDHQLGSEMLGILTELASRESRRAIPRDVWEVAADVFGGKVWNEKSRTRQSLSGRFTWALLRWDEMYGPLNETQREYASDLLKHACRKATDTPNGECEIAYALNEVIKLVGHERVRDGFRSRRSTDEPDPTILSLLEAA